MENINNIFLEVKDYINQDDRYLAIRENLIGDYEELEKIYSYYYKKQSCEKMKQQLKVSQNQQQINTEEEPSYCGEPYIQQQESTTYQVVASDLHGDISTFLNILVQNKIIDLKDSYEIVDLKTLKSYDTFASFKKKMGKKENDKIFLDARCVILPKFELNKDVKVTFNYLGDLIDEGRFSTECFYMMMMLMEKAKSCNDFEINYIAGNHEIANIMLESMDIRDHYLRQCTKYHCCSYDKSEYLGRSNGDIRPMPEQSHNFQMGCVAKHSKKLIENGQMKLVHIDGNKVFIHANPSIDSVISFLNIGKTKDEVKEIVENTIYKGQFNFLGDGKEERQYYLKRLNKLNTFFAEEVKENNLCKFNFDNEFLIYIKNCFSDNNSDNNSAFYGLTFLQNFVYFVGHDSVAELTYTFNGSELYCLDGHGKYDRRFVKIVGDEIYPNSVKSNEFQERYDALQQQFDILESEIAEKCGQNSLNKQLEKVECANAKMRSIQKAVKKDTTALLETEGLLENFGNAYAEIPDDKRGCICAPNGSGCFAM